MTLICRDLLVTAEDEYTYFAEGSPRLAGAEVRVLDRFNAVVNQSVTASDGSVKFECLREDSYKVVASGPQHRSESFTVSVVPGATASVAIFLPRTAVTYRFTVTPTPIRDTIRVNITPGKRSARWRPRL